MKTIVSICISLILVGCGARGPLYYLPPQKIVSIQQSNDKISKPVLGISNFSVLKQPPSVI